MKKTVLITSFCLIAFAIFADKQSLELFTDHTKGIISFLNSEKTNEKVKRIDFQMPSKGTKVIQPAAKKAFTARSYDFSTKTAYGDFQVNVIENTDNSFKVSFSSTAPIQRFQLVDSATKNISLQESLNDKTTYTFTVNKKFDAKYILILSQFKDDFLSQNIIPLYKKENLKYK